MTNHALRGYRPESMGATIRVLREAPGVDMTQEVLAARAGYGKGGAVSISRIERGLVNPTDRRLAGIALALRLTPQQLVDAAREHEASNSGPPGGDAGRSMADQRVDTKRRLARVNEVAAERAQMAQDLGEAFNEVHDRVRDDFFLDFVRLAETIKGAPAPEPVHVDPEGHPDVDSEDVSAPRRVQAISRGIGAAIRAAAAGGLTGAAAGGATAYGAFTAAAMFGTASTGTANTALSGAVAANATRAVLGGGTLAAGGAGVAGGTLLLTGMVAAPAAALAVAGFLVLKQRRTRQEEERLRDQVEKTEAALQESQAAVDAIADVLTRATEVLQYASVHATHALSRWRQALPHEPRCWDAMSESSKDRYQDFLTVSGCLAAVSFINIGELLTCPHEVLATKVRQIDEILTYAESTIQSAV